MTLTDNTQPAQTNALSFEFDLTHKPEKVWRALTDPELLTEWLFAGNRLEVGTRDRVHLQDTAVPRLGRNRELQDARNRVPQETQLRVDSRRNARHGRYVHFDPHRHGNAAFASSVGIQAGSKAELWWCTLRLEDDGRQAHRRAGQGRVSLLSLFSTLTHQEIKIMNQFTRQLHRWVSVAFTLCVIANFVAMGMGDVQPPASVHYVFATVAPVFAVPYRRVPVRVALSRQVASQVTTGLQTVVVLFHRGTVGEPTVKSVRVESKTNDHDAALAV